MNDSILALLFGTCGGFLSGLLGVGGGIIFIPVFDWLFRQKGLDNHEAVRFILANSFLAVLFSGAVSSYKHARMGTFYPRIILTIAIPAMIFGAGLSYIITGFTWYNEVYFKILFVLALVFTLYRIYKGKSTEVSEAPFNTVRYALIGVVTGIISALSGLGGGVAMLPLLTMVMGMDMRKAAGISIGVIPIMVLPFLVVYALQQSEQVFAGSLGYIQLYTSIPVIVGIFIGAPLGVTATKKIKSHQLQAIFAALLLLILVKYIIEIIYENI